jgi:hypothetical protein
MNNADVSRCANPECGVAFKRMGEGKLFVRPAASGHRGLTQKALWLCPQCALQFDLNYDRHLRQYQLIRLDVA